MSGRSHGVAHRWHTVCWTICSRLILAIHVATGPVSSITPRDSKSSGIDCQFVSSRIEIAIVDDSA